MEKNKVTKGKMLIVEDDRIISLGLRNFLGRMGYRVVGVASSGDEALELAGKARPDLALMDIVLKGPMDGIEAATRIKTLYGTPSIFLTAYTDKGRVERIKAAQPFGYILKPFQERELAVIIEMAFYRLSTERKMDEKDNQRVFAEHSLFASEIRYRRLFETAKDGILILDYNTGKIIDVNPFLIEMLALPKEKFLNKQLWELGFFKDIVQNKANFLRLKRKKIIRYENLPMQTGKGRKANVEFVSNVYDVGGQKVVQCNIRDITERRKTEEALAISEAKFRLMFGNAIEGVLIADVQTKRFVMANPALCRLLGYREKEILKLGVLDIHPKDQLPKVIDQFMRLANGKIKIAGAIPCLRKDGLIVFADISTSHFTIDNRKHIVGFFRDVTERKKAEEAMRKSEKRYHDIFESSLDALMLLDKKGFFDCNRASLKMFGYKTIAEFCSKHPGQLSPPTQPDGTPSMQLANKRIGEAYKKGSSQFEWVHRRKDGSDFFASVLLVPFELEGRKVLQATVRDITDRKRAEAKVAESQELFKAAFMNAPVGMALVSGSDEHFFLVNSQLCSILGYSQKEFRTLKYTALVHPDEVADTKQHIRKLIQGAPRVLGTERRFIHKNGSVVWAIVSAYAIRNGGPIDKYAVVHILDISDRKRAEKDILLKNALLEAQQEASIEGILAINPQGKVIMHNRRFADLWGIPPKVLKSSDDRVLLDFVLGQLKQPEAFLALVKKLYTSKIKTSQDLLEFKDGRFFTRYSSPLKDASGTHLGRIWFFRDVTRELQIDRAKSEFISVASHELRTPLNGVKWLLQAILRRGHLTTHQANFIRKAIESNEKMIGLANDLLDVSSLESGVTRPTPIWTDLSAFFEKLVAENQLLCAPKHQVLNLIKPRNRLFAAIDPKLIARALNNILSNAIRYSGKGTTIIVSLSSERGSHVIRVQDHGIGIRESDQRRLFEPFYRGIEGQQHSSIGSGLGLHIANKVVALCGGSLHIKSSLGVGTTVTVLIPSHSRKGHVPRPLSNF
jgi:PAS domain S-box-containing protein